MKYFPKKLWNGPTAIGESESRAMELTDLPYMTISSGEFMSRKRGMFREVTKKAVAAVPKVKFRASVWEPMTNAMALNGSALLKIDKQTGEATVTRNAFAYSLQSDWYGADKRRVAWTSWGRYDFSAQYDDPPDEYVRRSGRTGADTRSGFMTRFDQPQIWTLDQLVWVGRTMYAAPFYVACACLVKVDGVDYVKALGFASLTAARSSTVPNKFGMRNMQTGVWTTTNISPQYPPSTFPAPLPLMFNESGTQALHMRRAVGSGAYGHTKYLVGNDGSVTVSFTPLRTPTNSQTGNDAWPTVGQPAAATTTSQRTDFEMVFDWVGDVVTVLESQYESASSRTRSTTFPVSTTDKTYSYAEHYSRTVTIRLDGQSLASGTIVGDFYYEGNYRTSTLGATTLSTRSEVGVIPTAFPLDLRRKCLNVVSLQLDAQSGAAHAVSATFSASLFVDGAQQRTDASPTWTASQAGLDTPVTSGAGAAGWYDVAVNHETGASLVSRFAFADALPATISTLSSVSPWGQTASPDGEAQLNPGPRGQFEFGLSHEGLTYTAVHKLGASTLYYSPAAGQPFAPLSSQVIDPAHCYHGITLDMQ